MFWHWYCETVIFSRKSACFLFSTSTSRVWFFNFLTVIGVRFVDITFSIMNGDKLVIGELLDSMIMNLGKVASVSLSEESDLFKLHLNFLFEKEAIFVIYFSLVLCSTTHHGVQLEKGMNQGGNPFALAETGIQYQYTHAKSMIQSLCQILLLITQQSNSSHNSYLSTQLTLSPRLLARME